ncbi:mmuM [Ecytonucleospora hepatopenaei]|uniref:MmuM n=1 Tax=Ecytonucleospora hepatopenaei TaxID=646526 RepID=A0A1W0E545_9MICR|nr:mmuM [Ecytonucleospora hepatopenaei]
MINFTSKKSIVLLDGGVGSEMFIRSPNHLKQYWGNAAFIENGNEILKSVHLDFYKAGSQIAIANSYLGVKSRLSRKDKFPLTAEEICKMAVDVANEACKENGSGLVAGSLGPLFNSYRPDQDNLCSFEEQVEIYLEYLRNLSEADLFIFETVASIHHARVILETIKKSNLSKPVWISFNVDDIDGLKLRSGEMLSDVRFIADSGLVDAVLINCSKPESISKALKVFKTFGIPFGAYGNAFEDVNVFIKSVDYNKVERRKDLNHQVYADFVIDWIEQGAQIVGGCCEIDPEYISVITKRIRENGYELKKLRK